MGLWYIKTLPAYEVLSIKRAVGSIMCSTSIGKKQTNELYVQLFKHIITCLFYAVIGFNINKTGKAVLCFIKWRLMQLTKFMYIQKKRRKMKLTKHINLCIVCNMYKKYKRCLSLVMCQIFYCSSSYWNQVPGKKAVDLHIVPQHVIEICFVSSEFSIYSFHQVTLFLVYLK